jgi:hypothetical protein
MISVNSEQGCSIYKLQDIGRITSIQHCPIARKKPSKLRLKSMPQKGFETGVPMFRCVPT